MGVEEGNTPYSDQHPLIKRHWLGAWIQAMQMLYPKTVTVIKLGSGKA